MVPVNNDLYGTLMCMIAASACFDHASIVAGADSFVGIGGFAEKPIRNVRDGSGELDGTPTWLRPGTMPE